MAQQTDYLYLIQTGTGYYIGKQAASNSKNWYLTEHHGFNALKRLWGESASQERFSSSLENQWAQNIKEKGMKNSSETFILYAHKEALAGISDALQTSVNKKSPANGVVTLWEWLFNTFGVNSLGLTEALAILVLPQSVASTGKMVHNLKVDFFRPWPNNGVNKEWIKTTVLGYDAKEQKFTGKLGRAVKAREVYVNLVSWANFVKGKEFKKVIPENIQNSLKGALDNDKVLNALAKTLVQPDLLDKVLSKNPSKAIYRTWLEENKQSIVQGLKNRKEAKLLLDDSSAYQQAFIDWYQGYQGNILNFWTTNATNDIKLSSVQKYYKKRIAEKFQNEFEKIKGTYSSKSKKLKNCAAFKDWTYIHNNWSKFYREQMSIHYGQQFGGLVKISDTPNEFDEYEFGREKLLDKKGNIRVLFTSSMSEMSDEVKSDLQMTIY